MGSTPGSWKGLGEGKHPGAVAAELYNNRKGRGVGLSFPGSATALVLFLHLP